MEAATQAPAEEVIEATAEEVVEETPEQPAVVTEVVTRTATPSPSRQALMPLAADDVVAGMTAYQELLPRLLDDSDYQEAERGKRFVKKSGWRKIARAFNLSVTVESLRVERDEEGNATRAECVARATAPNGQVQDGDGYCSAEETRFQNQRGRQKLENDLRATATTRAKNRAIADLVGMGEVSAEEVVPSGGPTFERATAEEQTKAKQALGQLVGPEKAKAIYIEAIGNFDNLCPKGLAVALARLVEQPDPANDLPVATDE